MRTGWILLLLLLWVPSVYADHAAVERRLKRAGIDAPLRARIHSAIELGVVHLVSSQRPDGSWAPTWGRELGETLLNALAIAHADLPGTRSAVSKARAFAYKRDRVFGSGVYEISLALMLESMRETHSLEDKARVERLVTALTRGQTKTGWWHYRVPSSRGRHGEVVNLSTTQFAGLALWAGGRVMGQHPKRTWALHVKSLLRFASPDGSWPYTANEPGGAFEHPGSYASGTCMGFANLILAEAALGRSHVAMRRTSAARKAAHLATQEALERHVEWLLAGNRVFPTFRTPYYNLYALEKVCVFRDTEEIGGIRWYEEGALRLLGHQRADGTWPRASWNRPTARGPVCRVATSFALLFLLRVSETYRPVTPPSTPVAVTTPSGARPSSGQASPPHKTRPTFVEARRRLQRLQDVLARMGKRGSELDQALEGLVEVLDATPMPDMENAEIAQGLLDRWNQEATSTLLDVVRLIRVTARFRSRQKSIERAAAALARRGNGIAPELCEILERADLTDPEVAPGVVACLRALAKLGGADVAKWLIEHAMSGSLARKSPAVVEHAMRALRRCTWLPGEVRRAACSRILVTLASFERELETRGVRGARDRQYYLWERLRYDAVLTATHLARPGENDSLPVSKGGTPILRLDDFHTWWNENGSKHATLWRN